ncbi:MAG: rRNA maturation RNase YbeY [Spirochaetes bacterium]|jgi:probable rRNA maturation factor|nr:rRNA maturation RNase YbeY [Spirochaetota bacterium]
MEIDIFCEGKISLPFKGISKSKIRGFIEKICGHLKLNDRSITVIITDNNYIHKINRKYRKKDYATDVISFYYEDEPFPEENKKDNHLGDLFLSVEKAFEQALEYNCTFQDEIKRLLVHGILHLTGLDHERSKDEEKKMMSKEEKVLKTIRT